MNLYLSGHGFRYELENVARGFSRDVSVENTRPEARHWQGILLRRVRTTNSTHLCCTARLGDFRALRQLRLPADAPEDRCERALAQLLFDVLCGTTDNPPRWGIITGIRPAKFAQQHMARGDSPAAVRELLETAYRVAPEKAALAVGTALNARWIDPPNPERAYSLYVSIPFCPTRCSYCSFVSKTLDRDLKLADRYLDALVRELAATADVAARLGLRLMSVYVGGGTPTTLTAPQLAQLCAWITALFPNPETGEFCVEAGRPDTIDPEKLAVLRRAGVNRISINPQTGDDAVLKNIGRNHTAADIERAFGAARAAGFPVVNADLIAGLPGDTLAGFRRTLDWIFALDPENITLHALTLKRAARLTEQGGDGAADAGRMVDLAAARFAAAGYEPYYMYKQKGTVEGLENTGYAKPGTACLYNLYMMDEMHSILACGAGAMTKLVGAATERIARIHNDKYATEYLNDFEKVTSRKEDIPTFYAENF